MKRAALLISGLILLILGLYSVWLYSFTLPEHLQVNGEGWNITWVHFADSATLGKTYCDSHTIALSTGMPRADQATAIVHESMHALTCLGSNDVHNFLYNNDDDPDHAGIAWAAPHLVSLLAGNPHLAAFVLANGHKMTRAEAAYTSGSVGDGGPPFPDLEEKK